MKLQKDTNSKCIIKAVTVFGDKWIPLIIYCLSNTMMRFCQLQQAVGGVNPRTLTIKLGYLEDEGIITKVVYPEIPPRSEYSLTQKGKDLLPILRSMSSWGKKYNK